MRWEEGGALRGALRGPLWSPCVRGPLRGAHRDEVGVAVAVDVIGVHAGRPVGGAHVHVRPRPRSARPCRPRGGQEGGAGGKGG